MISVLCQNRTYKCVNETVKNTDTCNILDSVITTNAGANEDYCIKSLKQPLLNLQNFGTLRFCDSLIQMSRVSYVCMRN